MVLASAGLVFTTAGPASAATISSAGPLTSITISPDLNCAVNHVGDSQGEFFGDTACGTFLAVAGAVYGPATIPAGSGNPVAFTPVSQNTSGSGTAADPFTIVTVVDAGTTGVRLSQTDSYVVGQESYRTDVTVTNTTTAAVSAVLYKAGDCYLQDSDDGFGSFDAGTGAVSCVGIERDPDTNVPSPGSRIEQFYPLSAGSSYLLDYYGSVWSAVDTGQPFPNSCNGCATVQDNGAGLSWSLALAAGASATRSHLTTFSPLGIAPLNTSKTADQASTPAGGSNGYTITVHNPNSSPVTLSGITDALPAGFAYTSGSTTGATTANPAVSGQQLAWTGPFTVPAAGNVSIHFAVTVSGTPGTYYNNASGTSDGVAVAPTGDTAPVTVTAVTTNQPPSSSAGGPYSGAEGSSVTVTGTASDPDGDALTYAWSYAAGAGVDAGAACTFGNAAALATTIRCTDDGSYTLTLKVNDGHHPDVVSTANLTVTNVAPQVSITSPGDLTQVLVGSPVSVSATVTDPGSNDTHTCSISWGDGTTTVGTLAAGICTGTHSYAAIGTYDVTTTATDDDDAAGADTITLVVYDGATKVTGGGFVVDGSRVSFGFVAKNDGSGPVGQIQVRRHADKSTFHGSTVTALSSTGSTATWSGTGRWNRAEGYSFEVTVVDSGTGKRKGTADTITLTIRAPGGTTVLHISGPLKGGNITVH